MKVIVLYYSRGGTTKRVAELLADFIKEEKVDVDIADSENFQVDKLLDYDGIIIGSPTYYGTLAASVKNLFDQSVAFHGKLDGKVGAAFSTSANLAGGNETTTLSILEAMLIHGMVIQGDFKGDHYGSVAVAKVDYRTEQNCKRQAQRFVALLNSIKS
ncbi:MAG: NAD(P)H-dependent oxidoreductase [Candidatus Omnitrophica bacterium]|nr:NAD(P)H-dependent oxidoreductase [Candidatus Omnitrophota bacterium]MCF7878300.1 NAD(P)H-dependent oxidoreductase [Candidatus Omnitrophota bacterium]MCF7892765.1 NAD(P)H-dependent oxidoreductase [Candidatus Omnitrophota bacterium]